MRKEGEQQKLSFRKPVVMAFAALTLLTFAVAPARATTLSNRNPLRITAYDYAVAQAGKGVGLASPREIFSWPPKPLPPRAILAQVEHV